MGLWEKMLEVIYPSSIYCIACGAMIDDSRHYALCNKCVSTFHWSNVKVCGKCGKPLEEHYSYSHCRDCMSRERHFDKGVSCVLYGLYEKIPVREFKYSGKSYIGVKFGEIMHDRVEAEGIEADIIVPVPIHKRKERERGYNQAQVLAEEIGKRMKLPVCEVLSRNVYTKPMSKLTLNERQENLKNVFTVRDKSYRIIQGKRILLVDDIFTTGSTADECSRVLKEAGATQVFLAVFAAGGNVHVS